MTAKNILLWKNKIWESRVSNSGDLAIIRNTFLKLKAALPEATLHMFADDPEYASERYGVTAHPVSLLKNPLGLARLLKSIDLVILGGGTVLQDDYFIGVIPINLSVPLLAKLFGAKLVCNAIGVGSAAEVSRVGQALCRFLVHFDSISVRDVESKEIISGWISDRVPLVVTNDIAADLPSSPFEAIASCMKEEGISFAKPTIVIAARKIYHHEPSWLYVLPSSLRARLGLQRKAHQQKLEEFKLTLARFCDHLVESYDADVVLMPFYSSGGGKDSENRSTPTRLFSSGDNRFAKEVLSKVKALGRVRVLERSYSPEEMLAIIGHADALVGVPYHSVVFAASQNVPMLGIHYVSKVERYMKILGLERYAVPATLEAGVPFELLRDKFAQLWGERDAVRRHLAARNPELARLANANIEIIKGLLEEPSQRDAPPTPNRASRPASESRSNPMAHD
jgi:polysaccharide pyruvyl transferase WcaK-like protein